MEKSFLQLFLETGLFDIGDNDKRLEDLESSIKDLQEKLGKDHKLLPVYTLVVMDPKVPENELALIDTETIVSGYWKALRTKYADRPINILRGVILNALYNLGMGDPKVARIIVLTASNFYPYAELNKEAPIFQKFLTELAELAEKNATESWALGDQEHVINIPTLKISGVKFGEAKIDNSALEAGLLKATGLDPTHNQGPQHGPTYWGPHFAKTASATINQVFSAALTEFAGSLSPDSLQVPINKFFVEFKKSLDEVLKSSLSSMNAVEQRSKLLWWKETLYSPALKIGYREIDRFLQPLMMAYDLYLLLPAVTPTSVDYLLKDTLRMVAGDLDNMMSFSEFLGDMSKSEIKEIYKQFFEEKPDKGGRVSITDFITLLAYERANIDDLFSRTGIEPKRTMSKSYITTAVLHDLLATYLIK